MEAEVVGWLVPALRRLRDDAFVRLLGARDADFPLGTHRRREPPSPGGRWQESDGWRFPPGILKHLDPT